MEQNTWDLQLLAATEVPCPGVAQYVVLLTEAAGERLSEALALFNPG